MALFFHWLSLLLQSFCQLKQVQSTSLKSSVDVGDTILLYSNFFTFPHHKLNSTSSIEPHAVDSEDECIAECNENPQCRSLNFKPVAEADGKHICHLLDADMFTSPESFNSSSEFHHFSFTAPCDLNPCKNNGTCYPVTGEYDFKCACSTPSFRGKRCDLRYKNCAELLDNGFNKSGVYPVQSEMGNVYCDQTSDGGGWTMVFKLVAGVAADVYQLWSSADSLSEDNQDVLTVSSDFSGHYKNRLVQNWQMTNPKEVRVALYKDSSEVLSIVFNATDTSNEDWFSKKRLVHSPWTDLEREQENYFSVQGALHMDVPRVFYINRFHCNCNCDAGWLMVSYTSSHCGYERRHPQPIIVYSKSDTFTKWSNYENVGIADVMMVYIR